MRKLRVMLAAALLAATAFAEEMGRDASAYPHLQNLFIESGAVKTGCGEFDEEDTESFCGYAELSGSLMRGWIDLVLLPESAVSSWEAVEDLDATYQKSYELEGRSLDILLWEVNENYTVINAYHYLR